MSETVKQDLFKKKKKVQAEKLWSELTQFYTHLDMWCILKQLCDPFGLMVSEELGL